MAQPQKKSRIPKFVEAILIYVTIYLFVKFGITQMSVPLPASLVYTYMAITLIALFLYISHTDEGWEEFKRPIKRMLEGETPTLKGTRMAVFTALPILVGYGAFNATIPKFEAPFEIRTVHPSPPANVRVHGTLFNLQQAENPFRRDEGKYAAGLEKKYGGGTEHTQYNIDMWFSEENKKLPYLKDIKEPPEYMKHVKEGGVVFFKNCFICHGDGLDGRGMFAEAFNPIPANFQDAGTISQLQETFVFWRVSKGGPGLPRESTPWSSAMPVWENMLTTDQIWKVVLFEYWYTGFFPRTWD